MKKGDIIQREDIIPLRPIFTDAITPTKINEVIGKRLNKDVVEDSYIKWEDIENA